MPTLLGFSTNWKLESAGSRNKKKLFIVSVRTSMILMMKLIKAMKLYFQKNSTMLIYNFNIINIWLLALKKNRLQSLFPKSQRFRKVEATLSLLLNSKRRWTLNQGLWVKIKLLNWTKVENILCLNFITLLWRLLTLLSLKM